MKTNKSDILIIITLALLYYLPAEIRTLFTSNENISSAFIFPSEGIALAFALYFGKRVWPGIFIGQFFVAIHGHNLDFFSSLSIATVNSIEAIIAVTIFEKFKLSSKLKSFRDIIGLSIIIILVLQPFSAIFSNLALFLFGNIETNIILKSTVSWWFGNIIGQFLYTPLLLALFYSYKKINYKDLSVYTIFFSIFLTLFLVSMPLESPLLLLAVTLPVLLYILYRENILFSLFIVVITSYILTFYISYFHIGPFMFRDGNIRITDFNLYLLVIILVLLTANIIFENQKKIERILKEKIKESVAKNKKQELLMLQQNRLAQKGEMIAMIAHQWRQPLNNLALLHQLVVSKYYKGKLDDKIIEYFKTNANMHTTMMSETIDDFKDFFKPTESKQEFDINEVILNILTVVKPSLHKEEIKIIFLAKNRYSTIGFRNSFGHVMMNIINNAKDAFMHQTQTKTVDRRRDKKIIIEIEENNNNHEEIIISVKDTAGGIPEDIMDKIFDPYFSTRTEKNGTGLGLYMTQLIITEHMQAKISVENKNGGAVFNITLKGNVYEQ